jgi:hypothetical protein
MQRKLSMPFLLIPLVLFSFAGPLDAQTTTSGGLSGAVTDPSGAVVPDVTVVLVDTFKSKPIVLSGCALI